MLSGPKVLLSETTTQALGLTFHELATNALKYGEAGNSSDALKVEWQLSRTRASGCRLVLTWREDEQRAVTAGRKAGLRHQADRHEHHARTRRHDPCATTAQDGLQIEIEIPLSRKTRTKSSSRRKG